MAFTINGTAETAYHLNHIHTEISAPEPKRVTVNIPLADGELDLTAMMSPIMRFEMREISLGVELRGQRSDWPAYYMALMSDIHGREVNLILGDDNSYYWNGFATVGPLEDHGASAGIEILIKAHPFKRDVTPTTVYSQTISGDVTTTVTVTKARGYLTFDTSAADFTVSYDGQTWTLPQGVSTAFGLALPTGTHTLGIHGAGTIEITMEEGAL